MKYYFCLVSKEESSDPVTLGKTFVYKNRAKWIEASDISSYLTAGYVKGVDHVVTGGKAYSLLKSYIDLTEKFVVILCKESVAGCDN